MEVGDPLSELLLAGPRGRAVCLTVSGLLPLKYLLPKSDNDDEFVFVSAGDVQYDDQAARAIADALSGLSLGRLTVDDPAAIAAVAHSVRDAAYWQEPDADDRLLADPRVLSALRPVAALTVRAPATQWWTARLDLGDQWFVSWLWKKRQKRAEPPLLTGAATRRSRWRADAVLEERHAADERPASHDAPHSGSWWSTPVFSGLVTTTPRLPDGVPAQLTFVEDPIGVKRARVARLQPQSEVRVYEIAEPSDLVDLVARYPLPMDRARRHDWYRTTGCRGPWLIPDWAAIRQDYDAVHLTVLGYLAAAGRPLPVGDHYTMLAGWEPTKTWWLNDVLEQATEPVGWQRDKTWQWHQEHRGDTSVPHRAR